MTTTAENVSIASAVVEGESKSEDKRVTPELRRARPMPVAVLDAEVALGEIARKVRFAFLVGGATDPEDHDILLEARRAYLQFAPYVQQSVEGVPAAVVAPPDIKAYPPSKTGRARAGTLAAVLLEAEVALGEAALRAQRHEGGGVEVLRASRSNYLQYASLVEQTVERPTTAGAEAQIKAAAKAAGLHDLLHLVPVRFRAREHSV